MSSYGGTSNEVAEDFLYALKDLNMNSRYEISNLTVIAKENTEHALAISEALKNHIKQTAPIKKLPAFYVLDSIVKNVGTPYTLFFGRQLFSTFMEAYALVDTNTRRKMDEMLKTWKEPVPGSIDTRPVFPPEVTRPIETALIKARTSAVQAQQQHLKNQQQIFNRGRPSPVPFHRDTPTPPNNVRQLQQVPPAYPPYGQQQYAAPMNDHQYSQANGNQVYGLPQQPPSQQYPPSASSSNWQQAQPQGYRAQETSIDALNSDIANLILTSKADFAQNPYDSSIQTRLKALLDLQTILQSQRLPLDQIALIRDQVAALSEASKQPPPNQTPARPVPQPAPVPATVPPAQTPSLESVLGPGAHSALAALLARQSVTPQIATPPPQAIRSPQPTAVAPSFIPPPTSQSTPVHNPTSLLEQLKAAGILKGPPAANSTPPVSAIPLAGTLPPGFSMPFLGTPQPLPTGLRLPLAEIPNDVELKASSLKIPRPHLISSLYERLGAPCTQCGRRFQSDEEGKKKKAAHMDWHFRVHQRMTEVEKRGQHRSWYVDELDWIKTREDEDGHHNETADGGKACSESNSATAAKPRIQYLPVPDDPNANKVCPICQENFETKWLDDAQEWVWMDTQKVGKIIYHASCFAEVSKDDVSHQVKSPILGKRKAEDEHIALRAKIKTEPIY